VREKQAFCAEHRIFETANVLNVEQATRLTTNDTTRIDAQCLVNAELTFGEHSGMRKSHPFTCQALHDEALAAEQRCSNFALTRDSE
jgi:hypothetical protein